RDSAKPRSPPPHRRGASADVGDGDVVDGPSGEDPADVTSGSAAGRRDPGDRSPARRDPPPAAVPPAAGALIRAARFFQYAVPAMPSGLITSVTSRPTAPSSSAQLPDSPNQRSNECGIRPSVAPG